MRLSNVLKRDQNNFDLMRIVAALAVMFDHSLWPRTEFRRIIDPIWTLTGMEPSSSIAVYTFFMISGMLISQSFAKRKSVADFVLARVARVWPGLTVCVAITAFVVGPWMSRLSVDVYFSSADTYDWFWHNATLLFGLRPYLPGVFEPLHTAIVNIPLWTLPIEVKCYLIVLAIGMCGAFSSKWVLTAWIAVITAVFAVLAALYPSTPFLDDVLLKQHGYRLYIAVFFFVGMLAYAHQDSIKLDGRIAALLVAIFFLTKGTPVGFATFYIGLAYGVLYVGGSRALLPLKPPHDYSYGVYIYGFVVQQCVTTMFPTFGAYRIFAISVPVTICVAAISWHAIENPAIRLIKRRRIHHAIGA